MTEASMTEASMILRSSPASPFGRKVRMAADTLGLNYRIRIIPASTGDASDTLRSQNPLGKIPCLITASGESIYDSGVIIEYLQELAGTDRIVPLSGPARWRALTQARLADGITEAALLIVYEGRYRAPEQRVESWVAYQAEKIQRALAAFDAAPPSEAHVDLVSIGLSCALGYLDFRKPVAWRDGFGGLAAWLEAFEALHPVFGKTAPEMV
jgi:glutathione S-transferase